MLWAGCNDLHEAVAELMGKKRRQKFVRVGEGTSDVRPVDWRVWTPWAADVPAQFLADIIRSCAPLARAVSSIKQIRCELDSCRGSAALRDNFRSYFEEGFIKAPWLSEIALENCYAESGPEGEYSLYHEIWALTTLARPTAMLGRVTAMAKEVLLEHERVRNVVDSKRAPFAAPDLTEGAEPNTPPRRGGKPPNPQRVIWLARAKQLKDQGRTSKEVVEALKVEFGFKVAPTTIDKWMQELRKRA